MFYFQEFQGVGATVFYLFGIPVRPWVMACEAMLVIVVLNAQLLLRYYANLKTIGDGRACFVTIKWPLQLRRKTKEDQQVEISQGEISQEQDSVKSGMEDKASAPSAESPSAPTPKR